MNIIDAVKALKSSNLDSYIYRKTEPGTMCCLPDQTSLDSALRNCALTKNLHPIRDLDPAEFSVTDFMADDWELDFNGLLHAKFDIPGYISRL